LGDDQGEDPNRLASLSLQTDVKTAAGAAGDTGDLGLGSLVLGLRSLAYWYAFRK